jgi:hypothetical protein
MIFGKDTARSMACQKFHAVFSARESSNMTSGSFATAFQNFTQLARALVCSLSDLRLRRASSSAIWRICSSLGEGFSLFSMIVIKDGASAT